MELIENDMVTSEGMVYEYRCRECEAEWKTRHSIKESPVVPCPSCGSDDTHRIVGAPKVVLEGGGVGWARDGYYAHGNRDTLKALGNKVTETSREEFMSDLEKMK